MGQETNLDEVALASGALPAAFEFGALLLAAVDELQDLVELLVVHLRSLLNVGPRVAQGSLLGECLRLGHELVVDARLHESSGAGAAVLFGIDSMEFEKLESAWIPN